MNSRTDIYDAVLNELRHMFNKKDKILSVEMKKDNFAVRADYDSEKYFLCKFHGKSYGINEKEVMPGKFEFTINENEHNIEIQMEGEFGINKVIFTEKANSKNFIKLEISVINS